MAAGQRLEYAYIFLIFKDYCPYSSSGLAMLGHLPLGGRFFVVQDLLYNILCFLQAQKHKIKEFSIRSFVKTEKENFGKFKKKPIENRA